VGDRTPFQMTIVDIDPEDVDAVIEIINQYTLGIDWEGYADDHMELILGVTYCDDEITVGSAADIAEALQMNAPSAAFKLWEDPYLYLGDYWAFAPGLEVYRADCSHEGQPCWTATDITRLLKDPDKLDYNLGLIHQREIDRLRHLSAGTVLFEGEHPRRVRCSQCQETFDIHDHGMCAACLHDALRSGWDPEEES
jgi:hypothetical protein